MKGVLNEGPMEEPMEDEEVSPEVDEAVDQALEAVKEMIYSDDAIVDGMAKALTSAPSVVDGLVDQAAALLEITEQQMAEMVPDEGLILFAIGLMGEVAEIAQAAGVRLSGRDIAEATRRFILKIVQALGGDTSEVEAAMQAIDQDALGAAIDSEMTQ
jgi:hypothetical protein